MALTRIRSNNIADGAITTSDIQDNSITINKLAVADGTAGQVLTTDGNGNLSFADGGTGSAVGAFIDLTDTPATLVGSGGLFLKVNTAEDALEFGAGAADFADLTGQISLVQIPDALITGAKLADTYLTDVADGSITTVKLADGSVTNAKLNPNNVFVDEFTADGITDSFTLSQDPGSANALQVFVDGVPQRASNYTVVGTTLTLSGIPTLGQTVEARGYGIGLPIGTVADASITGVKLQDGTITLDKIAATNYYTSDDFVGNGNTTDFTLSVDPGSPYAITVYVAGVWQKPIDNYNVIGTTLAFTSAPANLEEIYVRYYGVALNVGTVADGSITGAKIQNGTITPDKIVISAYQTQSFTGDGATVQYTLNTDPGSTNALLVLVDNILQTPGTNYTSNGTTLTFTGAPDLGADIFIRYLGIPASIGVPSDASVTPAKLSSVSSTNIPEGTNLYYTDTRVGNYLTTNNYATQSYVGTELANLVDSAPTTLDTLNELAAALGDDPNFATTVTNSIADKLPLAGGTLTGNLGIGVASPSATIDAYNSGAETLFNAVSSVQIPAGGIEGYFDYGNNNFYLKSVDGYEKIISWTGTLTYEVPYVPGFGVGTASLTVSLSSPFSLPADGTGVNIASSTAFGLGEVGTLVATSVTITKTLEDALKFSSSGLEVGNITTSRDLTVGGNIGIGTNTPGTTVGRTNSKTLELTSDESSNTAPAVVRISPRKNNQGAGFVETQYYSLSNFASGTLSTITGTGANGFRMLIDVTLVGHTGSVGNAHHIGKYYWDGATNAVVPISVDYEGTNPLTVSFNTTSTANECVISFVSGNGGTQPFNGMAEIKYMVPIDFAGSTWSTS